MKRKLIFWVLWLLLLSLIPLTVFRSNPFSTIFANKLVLTNLIERIFGLTAFALMFWQILLGAYMEKWTDMLGGWVFKFHIWEGVAIYVLAVMHPIFFMLYNYFYGKGFDPFYIFTQVCALCGNRLEVYYTLGRVSFWLINITVFAGLFRAATPYMKTNWRKFHILNYVVFLIVGIHGLSIGTDFRIMPFFAFAIGAYLIVLYTIVRKLPALYSFLKNWLRS